MAGELGYIISSRSGLATKLDYYKYQAGEQEHKQKSRSELDNSDCWDVHEKTGYLFSFEHEHLIGSKESFRYFQKDFR